MKWTQSEVDRFPRCTDLMRSLYPNKFKAVKPQIYSAFIKACGDEKGAVRALQYGTLPIIHVREG